MNRMKIVLAAAIAPALISTAYGQMPPLNLAGHDKPARSAEQIEKDRAVDKAYRDATSQIPDRKSDPWGTIRGAEQKPTKSSAKP